jgi:hypothetical protein
MPRKFLQNTGPTLFDLETCEPLERTTSQPLISSAAASPARISPTLASEPVLTESDQGCGESSTASFASYDPATCSWKTWQLSWVEELTVYSETWPRAGTMRNGSAYPLLPLVHLTDVTGSFLWPTPNASKAGNDTTLTTSGDGRTKPNKLGWAVALWPTPTVHGMEGRNTKYAQGGTPLTAAVRMAEQGLWPTPTARDWRSGKASSATHERNSRPLNEVAAQGQASGQLNPTWVEWLMGFPEGWTDLEG